jgi:hypothetical protein
LTSQGLPPILVSQPLNGIGSWMGWVDEPRQETRPGVPRVDVRASASSPAPCALRRRGYHPPVHPGGPPRNASRRSLRPLHPAPCQLPHQPRGRRPPPGATLLAVHMSRRGAEAHATVVVGPPALSVRPRPSPPTGSPSITSDAITLRFAVVSSAAVRLFSHMVTYGGDLGAISSRPVSTCTRAPSRQPARDGCWDGLGPEPAI